MTKPDPITQQPGPPATGKPPGTPPPPVVTPPPAPPAAPPVPAVEPPGEPAPNYEKKFKGLQAVHQDLQGKYKNMLSDKDVLATQLTELQGSLESVRGEIDSLKTNRDESVVNLKQVRAELVDYKLWERKLARIRETAPHLAQFEKFITVELDNALQVEPSTLDEEHAKLLDVAIDAAIADFGKVMGDYVNQSIATQQAGVVPPSSPARGGEPSLDSLYELAISKAGTPEYDALMEQYTKSAAKQQGVVDKDGYWRPNQTQSPMP